MELQTAQRQQARIKMGLQGPSGSGKTYGALLIAYGLTGTWKKVCVIDTECQSAHLYSQLGSYFVLGIGQPYTPEKYIQAIELCVNSGMEAIILDSISHEWDGIGGILDIHGSMMGNSFTNWAKVTPRHNAFVQKILQTPVHIIATIRSKQDWVLSDKGGKMVPEKVGLKGVTRDGMDYEFTAVLELDIKHNCTASKDRTGMFMDKPQFLITEEIGQRIKEWCQGEVSLPDVLRRIEDAGSVEELRAIHLNYPSYRELIREALVERKKELDVPVNAHII